jgi:hypothetical protein
MSVKRWRSRKIEQRMPFLKQKDGGYGLHIMPLHKLLDERSSHDWGANQKGALRSTFTNRQWPQCRLKKAKFVEHDNCLLCVKLGFCEAGDSNPMFRGTLLHRHWLCPATKEYRERMVPAWLLREVEGKLRGGVELEPADLALYTRALLPSPDAIVDTPPEDASFVWCKRPESGIVEGSVYLDGSRLFADWKLAGFCARQGWAFAAFDADGNQTAAAHGRTPRWIRGINATELWALLMGVQTSDAFCTLYVDCQAVQKGSQNGSEWASSAARKFARAWAPIASNLEEDIHRVVWMPAHCTASQDGLRTLSDGQPLTETRRKGNAAVDELAKSAARQDAPPQWQLQAVAKATDRLMAIGKWIGRIGALANRFPLPEHLRTDKCHYIRDAEGIKRPPRKKASRAKLARGRKHMAAQLFETPRLAALRARILARSQTCTPHKPLVLAPPVKVPRYEQARANYKRKRQSRLWPMANAGGVRGRFEAQVYSCPPACVSCVRPVAAGASIGEEQWTVDGDLQELERDGLRVSWPCQPRTPARPAEPAPLPRCARGRSPGPAPEVTAALKDLEELRACGYAVTLPR